MVSRECVCLCLYNAAQSFGSLSGTIWICCCYRPEQLQCKARAALFALGFDLKTATWLWRTLQHIHSHTVAKTMCPMENWKMRASWWFEVCQLGELWIGIEYKMERLRSNFESVLNIYDNWRIAGENGQRQRILKFNVLWWWKCCFQMIYYSFMCFSLSLLSYLRKSKFLLSWMLVFRLCP